MVTDSGIPCSLEWLDKEPLALFLLIKTAKTRQRVTHLASGCRF